MMRWLLLFIYLILFVLLVIFLVYFFVTIRTAPTVSSSTVRIEILNGVYYLAWNAPVIPDNIKVATTGVNSGIRYTIATYVNGSVRQVITNNTFTPLYYLGRPITVQNIDDTVLTVDYFIVVTVGSARDSVPAKGTLTIPRNSVRIIGS